MAVLTELLRCIHFTPCVQAISQEALTSLVCWQTLVEISDFSLTVTLLQLSHVVWTGEEPSCSINLYVYLISPTEACNSPGVVTGVLVVSLIVLLLEQ